MTAAAGMPTAVWTFLFTDLEGSTRTWEHDADAMDGWLAAHDEILTRAIEARGGQVFKHTGDGLCAVFSSAPDAVTSAVDLQRALVAASDAAVGPLRARVALHTGEARERGGDFYGPTLNRCARLLEIAHGGQVLLSGPVVALINGGAALASDLTLHDLGRHRLRDLQQPERVWQIAGEGLASAFPPLRSLDAFTHNLPVQRSTFVGREAERETLRGLLAADRLVTITGVGGCGKTRLALAVAAEVMEKFRDGIFFIDLSTQMEPALVATTIIAALGLPAGQGSAEDRLIEFLGDRVSLLLLDNCEHLLDACAATADRLLSSCPALEILATSREPLSIDGERVWRVPSLGLPSDDALDEVARSQAARLFVDRAAAVRPGFALNAGNAATIADVCRRLDGIPLAIELAAARVAHLAPQEVAARLNDRFRLLSGGRRAVQRQQTLQAVLDWSHDLLSEPERVLLRRLSVFAGGWTLEAAQGVCAGDGFEATGIVDLLGALVSRSLVDLADCGDYTRYRLLETVRLYSQDQLMAAGEAATVRSRHAEWYLRHVEREARGGPWFPPTVLMALDADLDNLRQAIDWWRDAGRTDRMGLLAALSINEFHVQARLDEPEEWLRTALAEPSLDRALRARCLTAMAVAIEMRGDFAHANWWAREAIATAEQPEDAGGAYGLLATNLVWIDPDEAETLLAEARWASSLGADAGRFVDCIRATLACARFDYERAAGLVRGISDDPGDWIFTGASGGIVATAHALHGDLDAAEAVLETVEAGFGKDIDRWPRANVHFLRAMIEARRGNGDAARAHARQAVGMSRRWKIPLVLNDGVLACVAIAFHEGRVGRASELLGFLSATTGGALRSPMSMCLYRDYRRLTRAALDRETIARARAVGAALSLDAVLAGELDE